MASGIVNIVLRSAAESSGFAETLASARRLSGENAGNDRQRMAGDLAGPFSAHAFGCFNSRQRMAGDPWP